MQEVCILFTVYFILLLNSIFKFFNKISPEEENASVFESLSS